jgi:hypothetical protein
MRKNVNSIMSATALLGASALAMAAPGVPGDQSSQSHEQSSQSQLNGGATATPNSRTGSQAARYQNSGGGASTSSDATLKSGGTTGSGRRRGAGEAAAGAAGLHQCAERPQGSHGLDRQGQEGRPVGDCQHRQQRSGQDPLTCFPGTTPTAFAAVGFFYARTATTARAVRRADHLLGRAGQKTLSGAGQQRTRPLAVPPAAAKARRERGNTLLARILPLSQ